jgi:hypothetical protein
VAIPPEKIIASTFGLAVSTVDLSTLANTNEGKLPERKECERKKQEDCKDG